MISVLNKFVFRLVDRFNPCVKRGLRKECYSEG
jgi:hypothetical protein